VGRDHQPTAQPFADFTATNVKLLVARKLSNGLSTKSPKRDGCHGSRSRIEQKLLRKGFVRGIDEEEAFARRRLDRAGWWHRCLDHLSSRLRADCPISPLILGGGRIRVSSGARRLLAHFPPGVSADASLS